MENHAFDVNVAKRSEWPAAKTTIDLALVRRNLLDTVRFVSAPGTPNNHFFQMDVCLNNHFLCKDWESSNRNNHLEMDGLSSSKRYMYLPPRFGPEVHRLKSPCGGGRPFSKLRLTSERYEKITYLEKVSDWIPRFGKLKRDSPSGEV